MLATKHASCKGLDCMHCIQKNRGWMLKTTYSRHILDLELLLQPNAWTKTGPPQVTQHLTQVQQGCPGR